MSRDAIIESMARTFYVMAWANREEERGRCYPGQDLMDVAPATSRAATRFAARFTRYLEALNHETIEGAYVRAVHANYLARKSPPDRRCNPDAFGHCIAMEAMGHGVGWDDDNAPFQFVLCDAHWYGQHGEIDARFLSSLDGARVEGKPYGWTPPKRAKRPSIIAELWLCDDCTIVHANDDVSGIDDETRVAAIYAGFDRLSEHGQSVTMNDDPDTGEGRLEFSSRGCDCCLSRLGGSLTRFALWSHYARPR